MPEIFHTLEPGNGRMRRCIIQVINSLIINWTNAGVSPMETPLDLITNISHISNWDKHVITPGQWNNPKLWTELLVSNSQWNNMTIRICCICYIRKIITVPLCRCPSITLIARFMGPTWGPSGADRTQVGPMLASWSLLSGYFSTSQGTVKIQYYTCFHWYLMI